MLSPSTRIARWSASCGPTSSPAASASASVQVGGRRPTVDERAPGTTPDADTDDTHHERRDRCGGEQADLQRIGDEEADEGDEAVVRDRRGNPGAERHEDPEGEEPCACRSRRTGVVGIGMDAQ